VPTSYIVSLFPPNELLAADGQTVDKQVDFYPSAYNEGWEIFVEFKWRESVVVRLEKHFPEMIAAACKERFPFYKLTQKYYTYMKYTLLVILLPLVNAATAQTANILIRTKDSLYVAVDSRVVDAKKQ
jgi:hypothetical protein